MRVASPTGPGPKASTLKPKDGLDNMAAAPNGPLYGISGPKPHGGKGGGFGKAEVNPAIRTIGNYSPSAVLPPKAASLRAPPGSGAPMNLTASMDDLSYDPFYKNQQQYIAAQKAKLDK